MVKTCILFRNTFVLFFWEMIKIFAAVKQMENWYACAAVLWMFCPPGLRAGHVTENYELHQHDQNKTVISRQSIKVKCHTCGKRFSLCDPSEQTLYWHSNKTLIIAFIRTNDQISGFIIQQTLSYSGSKIRDCVKTLGRRNKQSFRILNDNI